MKIRLRRFLQIAAYIFISTLTAVIGFNCSGSFKVAKQISESSTEPIAPPNSPQVDMNSAAELPQALMTPTEIFRSMQVATQVTPSTATINEFNARVGTFPVEGQLAKINTPMLTSLVNLSSQYCQQLIDKEKVLSMDQRVFFPQVNFNQGPAMAISDSMLSDSIRRMARSFWSRNETSDELKLLQAGFADMIQELTAAQQKDANHTTFLTLSLCTVMLATVDTISL